MAYGVTKVKPTREARTANTRQVWSRLFYYGIYKRQFGKHQMAVPTVVPRNAHAPTRYSSSRRSYKANAYTGQCGASLSPAEACYQHGALARAHGHAGVRHAAGKEQGGARGGAQDERRRRASRVVLICAARPEAGAAALESARPAEVEAAHGTADSARRAGKLGHPTEVRPSWEAALPSRPDGRPSRKGSPAPEGSPALLQRAALPRGPLEHAGRAMRAARG